jgi:UDP-N-acetylmuramyl-tripeptide synthetase
MRFIKALVPQAIKNVYHLGQAIVANVAYGFPSRKMKVIGVTGSDGKTTTTQMVAKILQEAGKKVAVASTINFVINGQEEKNLSHYTTESAFAVQKFIAKAASAGCEYLVLETSSHALDQYRVWGVKYQTAIITNVTREHLDYHRTMEKYREAKKKLFKMVEKNKGTIIVNMEMEKPEDYMQYAKTKAFAYSISNFQFPISNKFSMSQFQIIQAKHIELGINFSKFTIFAPSLSSGQNLQFVLNIPGEFNIENALAATCVGLGEGIGLETIKEALAKIKGISGRLENVPNERGLHIIVDFALTPNALEKLYNLLAGVKKEGAKIIAVFGSCGERDRGKRPIMGEVVSNYADKVILTNDEPYHEDPVEIIEEIALGIKNKTEGQDFWKIVDRRSAIKKALEIAKTGDIVVVTGMGNFETMVVGDKKIPWNDKKVIEEELQ